MAKNLNHHSNRKRSLTKFIIGFAVLIIINVLGTYKFFRLDLTQEKRYTLSDQTIKLVEELDDIVYFKIYLGGELPAEYARLKNSVRETLEEFKAYNNANIQFEFIDPSEIKDKKTQFSYSNELEEKGLRKIIDFQNDGSSKEEKEIWPGAIVTYKSKEVVVNFVKSELGNKDNSLLVNESIESLEYNLIDGVKRLFDKDRPMIAFIEGHGESDAIEVEDIALSLDEYYTVKRVKIDHQLKILKPFKTIIIADPDSAFDEKDKFIIDQFIMNGGRVLWLIDGTQTSMDSLVSKSESYALANDINLDDMLFKYGVRINYNLVLDGVCAPLAVKRGMENGQPQWTIYDNWYYHPAVSNPDGHPIVKNLNYIFLNFASSIDLAGTSDVAKTVLLTTSQYSKIQNDPVISLKILQDKIDPSQPTAYFNKSFIPVAVLLEGSFSSVFANRIPPEIAEDKEIGFREKSPNNRMIVVSDGDVINNKAVRRNGKLVPYPLGKDPFVNITYGNKDFLINCINYLTDETDLLSIRAREFKIRLLNKTKVDAKKSYIQWVNVLVPIFITIAIGIILMLLRKYNAKLSSLIHKLLRR